MWMDGAGTKATNIRNATNNYRVSEGYKENPSVSAKAYKEIALCDSNTCVQS
jgi:hypothetical protein